MTRERLPLRVCQSGGKVTSYLIRVFSGSCVFIQWKGHALLPESERVILGVAPTAKVTPCLMRALICFPAPSLVDSSSELGVEMGLTQPLPFTATQGYSGTSVFDTCVFWSPA